MRSLVSGIAMVWLLALPTVFASEALTDKEITNILIQQSIRNYSGSCPCPYNRDKTGQRCGTRSVWNKPGGASPYCFASDITSDMINQYRQIQRKPNN